MECAILLYRKTNLNICILPIAQAHYFIDDNIKSRSTANSISDIIFKYLNYKQSLNKTTIFVEK